MLHIIFLQTALRLWAQETKIDKSGVCMFPSHLFPILLVYYAKSLPCPVLPSSGDFDLIDKGWVSGNKMSPAELWIDFFCFYSLNFKKESEVVRIDLVEKCERFVNLPGFFTVVDPFSLDKNLWSEPGRSDELEECIRKACVYFLDPLNDHFTVYTYLFHQCL